jgi:hypothetical protein
MAIPRFAIVVLPIDRLSEKHPIPWLEDSSAARLAVDERAVGAAPIDGSPFTASPIFYARA